MQYSLCANKKITSSIEHTFACHMVRQYTPDPNLVVRLSDGHLCFYLPADVFTRLFLFSLECTPRSFHEHLCTLLSRRIKTRRRTRRLSSARLRALALVPGRNALQYKLAGVDKHVQADVYLYDSTTRLVVSDIDGTITKSDILGHIYDFVGKDWTHCGVARLYNKIVKNGYKIVYLSNRAMSMYRRTRAYLEKVDQEGDKLPEGPIMLAPRGIFRSLYCEVRNESHVFKIGILKEIRELFRVRDESGSGEYVSSGDEDSSEYVSSDSGNNSGNNSGSDSGDRESVSGRYINGDVRRHGRRRKSGLSSGTSKTSKTSSRANSTSTVNTTYTANSTNSSNSSITANSPITANSSSTASDEKEANPFFAGFGNKISDLLAYKLSGIAKQNIFIIEPHRKGKDDLTATSSSLFLSSYLTLNHFANTIFPEVREGRGDGYDDYSYFGGMERLPD